MEPGFLRPLRWRAHEQLLVTIVILTAIAGYFRPLLTVPAADLADIYGRAFIDAHLDFDYPRNVLFPRVGLLLLIYGCYWWINGYIIPFLMRNTPAPIPMAGPVRISIPLGKVIRGLLNIFLLTLILAVCYGNVYTFTNEPEVIEHHLSTQLVIGIGLRHVTAWVVGYIAYAAVRDVISRRIDTDPAGNAFLAQTINQLTGFCLLYFSVGIVLHTFVMHDAPEALRDTYFLFLPPLILAGYSNIYWIFPLKADGSLFSGWNGRTRRRLLISTFCWQIPFVFYGVADEHATLPLQFLLWGIQLSITTPVSWYIYAAGKDKLLRLKGLQTALGQSEADLQFLRSQINPHFLFNVLNTLYGTALQEQASRTAAGVQRLGDMMRFMLHENNMESIPMSREVEYLKNYIALQELRTETSGSINIETIIDENFPDVKIAPMLLIPFVENGFKHGISLREPSWIKLRLQSQGDRIFFELRNSIHTRKGDDPEKTRSGIGLKNVLHRLRLLYPDRHEFHMHQDDREFFVQLSIQP